MSEAEVRKREFDVVVYGATGFTGGLVAEYLLAKKELPVSRWAIAGRDRVKLTELRARLKEIDPAAADLALINASSGDPVSLESMCARSKVVITTVGPYKKYGEPLVAAALRESTDYVDLTGEPSWWKQMIERYHDRAEAKGVRRFLLSRSLCRSGFGERPLAVAVFDPGASAPRFAGFVYEETFACADLPLPL